MTRKMQAVFFCFLLLGAEARKSDFDVWNMRRTWAVMQGTYTIGKAVYETAKTAKEFEEVLNWLNERFGNADFSGSESGEIFYHFSMFNRAVFKAFVQVLPFAIPVALITFAAIGDPRICPAINGAVLEEECVEYTGPATMMCYESTGKLQSIDLVGVCDENGKNCQAKDAFWVGEQWRFDLSTGAWKYRDARGTKNADVSCDNEWVSEKSKTARPPQNWVDSFKGTRSFILDANQPRVLDGPGFDFVWEALNSANLNQNVPTHDMQPFVETGLYLLGYAKVAGEQATDRVRILAEHLVAAGIVALNPVAKMKREL